MKRLHLPVAVVVLLLLGATATSWAKSGYVFQVHPFKKPTKLKQMFTPLTEYLSEVLGAPVKFRSAKDYATALDAFLAGKVDFTYAGPSSVAWLAHEHPDKIRIGGVALSNGTPTFQGVIVARDDSPIQSLADLQGKKIAFGDRNSTLSCYVPAHMLMLSGVFDTVEYKFLGSHDNVALGVMNGTFDAGGLKPGVAYKYVGKGLRVVAESEPVYEHVVLIGPGVDAETAEKVRAALLNCDDPAVLTAINKSFQGFASVAPSSYENLTALMEAVDQKIPKD